MGPSIEQTIAISVRAGQTLADGRYSLERHLRDAGQIDVFLGRDHLLARPVVVRVAKCENRTFAAVFKREAQLAARLNHPNVVAVYDWGEDDGLCYAVGEYVPGPSLEDVLGRRGPMPEAQALGVAEQIAEALEAAHSAGLIHGGLSPRTIVFDALGQAKVDDFGVAAAHANEADTAPFVAPEVAEGRPLDARSDVYAVGALIAAMVAKAPSPISEPILATATATDPADRHPSATALRDALHQARSELLSATIGPTERMEPVPAAAVAGAVRAPRRFEIDRRLALGAVLLLLVFLAFFLVTPANRRVTAPLAPQAPTAQATPAAPAAVSAEAASCRFVLGFKQLRDRIPTIVGDCVENERWIAERSETVQRTSRGLLVWRKADGISAFTDGARTWVDGPLGLQERLNTQRFNWERG